MIEINRFYIENCLDTMARMPNEFIDLTVTSPPYDNLRDYNGYEFDFENIAKELYRVTKQGGVVVWVVNDETKNGSESLTSAKQKIFFREQCGFNIHDTMIFKRYTFPTNTKHKRFMGCFEYMIILSKGKPIKFNPIFRDYSIETKKRRKTKYINYSQRENDEKPKPKKLGGLNENGVLKENIWEYKVGNYQSTKDKLAFNHPAIFPEKLVADHIYSWSNKNDSIYDPMCGSGTTVKMAIKLKRNWIATDISEEYIKNIAEKRIRPLLMQETLF